MKRGIIANNGEIRRLDDGKISISRTLSSQDLNYYLLYWDKIIIPRFSPIHFAIDN